MSSLRATVSPCLFLSHKLLRNFDESVGKSVTPPHLAGSLERPVVQASTPGTQPRDSVRPLRPALRNLASAPADMRYSVGEGPPAVDDKAEVEATPSEDESRVQRQLQYDEAVNQAFPDDMYSQQLANGLPGRAVQLYRKLG